MRNNSSSSTTAETESDLGLLQAPFDADEVEECGYFVIVVRKSRVVIEGSNFLPSLVYDLIFVYLPSSICRVYGVR